MARTAFEEAVVSGVNLHAGAKHSDGTFPHNFWVSPNGADGIGNGSQYAPFLTGRRAIRESIDGRGDRVLFTPGSYAETIDIGSGSTAGGNNSGGYAKRNLQLIGDDSVYNGLIQIIGDGTTTAPTIRVQAGYLRGFVLKNMELDTNGVAEPALELITDDDGSSPSATDNYLRFRVENIAVRSNDPDVGILLTGATLGRMKNILLSGPTIGLAFTGSLANFPADLELEDFDFYRCTTADVFTAGAASSTAGRTTVGAVALTHVLMHRFRFWDRGGTPVTNYANMQGTMENVHFFDFISARDVADGTLMELPANVTAIGRSADGDEFIIGA